MHHIFSRESGKGMHNRGRIKNLVISFGLLICYVLYLFKWFDLTLSTGVNYLIAGLLFLGIILLFSVRYIETRLPENRKYKLEETTRLFFISGALAYSISLWSVTLTNIEASVTASANWVFNLIHVFNGFQIDINKWYIFPFTIATLTIILVIIVFAIIRAATNTSDKFFFKRFHERFLDISFFFFILTIGSNVFISCFSSCEPGSKLRIYWGGTETLVTDRIRSDYSFIEDIKEFGGFHYVEKAPGVYVPYFSQTGFYGSILKATQSAFNIPPLQFIPAARIFLSFSLAIVIAIIATAVRKNTGTIASLIFFIPTLFSFWIIGPAGYLIWFLFLLYLPFVFSLLLYQKVLAGEMSIQRFLLLSGVLFFFVFLRGYTYASNIILSALVPILYFEFQAQRPIKEIAVRAIGVTLSGLFGFAIAFAFHFLQLAVYLHSAMEAFHLFTVKTEFRISGSPQITYLEVFNNWLEVKIQYLGPLEYILKKPYLDFIKQGDSFLFMYQELGALVLLSLLLGAVNQFYKYHRRVRII